MSINYQQLLFSDIKHKLPKDCWAYSRNERKNGELDNEPVLYFNGDLHISDLDLNDPFGIESRGVEPGYALLILVEGNMVVDNYIYNEEVDSATGLIVLGDLTAKNIVVGGQEIYVDKNLQVAELFFGEYNHGELKVNGSITARVFISKDYHFDYKRFDEKRMVDVQHFLWDERDMLDDDALSILNPEVLILGDDEPIIVRSTIRAFFDEGRSVLVEKVPESIPFVFKDDLLTIENLTRLRNSILFLDNYPADKNEGWQTQEYWKGADYKRVRVMKEMPFSETVYFEQGNKAILVGFQLAGDQEDAAETKQELNILVRIIEKDKEPDWYYFDPTLPGQRPFISMGSTLWKNLLTEWSEMEYYMHKFDETVTRKRVEKILALDIAKEYGPDSDEDLWQSSFGMGFTQPDEDNVGWGKFRICKEIPGKKDDYEFYIFHIRELLNGETKVLLYTRDGQGDEHETYFVGRTDTEKYKKAIQYFLSMEKRLYFLNEDE
ncbi:hypothetical protein HHL16_13525 [Pseudoflavitalea sp. G-6-1-2]|uniref:hypothetical protein n=1 Tax=Pseudoflavitalea sp. G-6-1-2 TaxID=2728841 RepID=UPI00146C1E77|nr:hypothetical protein [Pseudoflavitalea sp. G-6-1-2]NML21904.1 hypothetical protein [Pseudoflavitalea sp. G-6-1-2]